MKCNGLTFDEGEGGTRESTPKVNGISHNSNSPKALKFSNSTSYASLGNDTLITFKKQTKKTCESPKIQVSQPHFEASVRMRLTLPKSGNWESSETPATLELNSRGQNTLP
jgi:hypothetical protein